MLAWCATACLRYTRDKLLNVPLRFRSTTSLLLSAPTDKSSPPSLSFFQPRPPRFGTLKAKTWAFFFTLACFHQPRVVPRVICKVETFLSFKQTVQHPNGLFVRALSFTDRFTALSISFLSLQPSYSLNHFFLAAVATNLKTRNYFLLVASLHHEHYKRRCQPT